jgi:Ca2+/H+ antiporter, TMEM165/GDT1 family
VSSEISAGLPLVLSTFGLVFLAEVPDKTALASLMLATYLPPRQVIAGAWLAFLVQTVVAVAAGGLLSLLPDRPIRVAAGLGFCAFAVMAWRREGSKGELERASAAVTRGVHRRPAWVAAFLVVFAAEWGDLTQLMTAALVAHGEDWLAVAVGALAALWLVTVLAALAGARIGRVVPATVLNRASAMLFAGIGLVVIATALRA